MTEPASTAASTRIIQLAGQPLRIAAVLQSGTPSEQQTDPVGYAKGPSVVGSSASRMLRDTLLTSQQTLYSDVNAETVDDVVSTEDDSNCDSLMMRAGIAGIDALGDATTFQLLSQDEVEEHGLQAVALGNDDSAAAAILQCTHAPDGQIFIPVHQLNSASLPRGIVMATSSSDASVVAPGNHLSSTAGLGGATAVQLITVEDSARRRQLRLLKNKEAAKECRRKKKEYVRCLENRVAVLENQNRTLIDELKSLKELYCQKDLHS